MPSQTKVFFVPEKSRKNPGKTQTSSRSSVSHSHHLVSREPPSPATYPLAANTPSSELFLEKFSVQAFDHAGKLGRKTIKYRDVSDVRVQDPNLLFLEAVVPP